jgi:hypothetical protein
MLSSRPQAHVHLLEVDPELGLRIPPEQVARAREVLVASVQTLEPGIREVPRSGAAGHVGFLIIEGLIARDLTLAGNVSTELLGEGDLMQPWVAEAEGLLHCHVLWHVLSPVSVAVLDPAFAKQVREWPQVFGALLERAVRRTVRMAVHQAVLQLSPVETRLLVLFWHLADRWGRVTRDGIVLPLGLTHQVLGQLVGSQRASVTTALGAIARSGRAVHREDGSWLLRGNPPDELSRLSWSRAAVAVAG